LGRALIPDQKALWDVKHAKGEHDAFHNKPSTLAVLAAPKLPKNAEILELGCGTGRDAELFAKSGHKVTATDLSDVIIEKNKKRFAGSGIEFMTLDMQNSFPYPDSSFDVVYANLAIHYYNHAKTQVLVSEVARVLKPKGLFIFGCKSTNDFHYGNGKEVEKDVFVSDKGHVRHLFSTEYTKELLAEHFQIELIQEVEEIYSGEKSVMIQCIASKRAK
jgi:SAM-dependent methyltransferase